MAEPAELPDGFEFPDLALVTVPETEYDFETIAEAALWPLVDTRWGGDFRGEGEPNLPPFSISRAGYFEGEWYEVTLEASTDSDEYWDDESRTQVKLKLHALDLFVERLVPGQTQAMIDMALEEGSEPLRNYLAAGEEAEGEEAELPESELRAVVGVRYLIDSEGDSTIVPYISLQNHDRDILWNKGLIFVMGDEDEESEQAGSDETGETPRLPEPEFGSEDVRNLLIASTIMKSPLNLTRYLEAVLRNADLQ